MALIAVAADKGAPGVTTASVALAAVWPRPVLLAECDPAGGDLVYRLPGADGVRLDPRRGLLSLAVAARRGLQPHQVWEHAQKLRGGLDILAGVSGAEQGAGLELLWGSVGRILAAVPQADVIADCGRVGVDGPVYDLLAQASAVILLTRVSLGEVIRVRDRVSVLAAALQRRGRPPGRIDVVVMTDYKNFGAAITEVGQALRQGGAPARVVGGLAYEPKSANQLRGEWNGKLDKSMFIRTARAIAGDLASTLPGPSSGTRQSAPAASQAWGSASGPAGSQPPASAAGPAGSQPSGLAASQASGLAASQASGLAGDSASGPATRPASRPGASQASGPASSPSSRRAPGSAAAPGRGVDGQNATVASVFRPASAQPTATQSASAQSAAGQPTTMQPAAGQSDSAQPASAQPAAGQPASAQSSSAQSSSAQSSSAQSSSAQSSSGQPTAMQPAAGQPATIWRTAEQSAPTWPAARQPSSAESTVAQPQGPGPSRPSYLDSQGRPGRESPRDPAAVDRDRTPQPTRPAAAPPVPLGARGRHAGTPAAADGNDQRPPELDGEQQAEAHPPWPEPTSGTPQSRPKGS